jgi:hypothetical protein
VNAPAAAPLTEGDLAQIRADHGLALAAHETAWWRQAQQHLGVSSRGGFRAGWWKGIEYLLTSQNGIDGLTVGELLAELRKGPGSIYWPLKSEDPKFWADCPACHRPVLIDAEGMCPNCTHEFNEGE